MARFQWRVQRWFEDWAFSSAGRSGAIAGHHWAFKLTDWDGGATIGRELNFTPLWAHTARIGQISPSLKGKSLWARLQRLDQRIGVPFAWYHYLLHGNIVRDASGHRVLRMYDAGEIDLPDHDAKVLRAWVATPYGF